MNRTVWPFRDEPAWRNAAAPVATELAAGRLLAHPTETVYGLGCALRPDALARLSAMKRRAAGPFLVLLGRAEPIAGVEWPDSADRLAAAFWPGPLTLVVKSRAGAFPDIVLGADGTLALRATSHPGLGLLLRELDAPMTSTSANAPSEPPAASLAHVHDVLDRLDPEAAVWLLDGGDLAPSAPSTLVDCSGGRPRILRSGAIDRMALREVIGDIGTA